MLQEDEIIAEQIEAQKDVYIIALPLMQAFEKLEKVEEFLTYSWRGTITQQYAKKVQKDCNILQKTSSCIDSLKNIQQARQWAIDAEKIVERIQDNATMVLEQARIERPIIQKKQEKYKHIFLASIITIIAAIVIIPVYKKYKNFLC